VVQISKKIFFNQIILHSNTYKSNLILTINKQKNNSFEFKQIRLMSADFDKGWFLAYKVILYLFGVYEAVYVILNILALTRAASDLGIYYLFVFEPLIVLVFVIFEILAMKNKDVKKAKIALFGFAGYAALLLLCILIVLVGDYESTWKSSMLVALFTSLILLLVFIVYGAVQVYKALGGSIPATANDYNAVQNA